MCTEYDIYVHELSVYGEGNENIESHLYVTLKEDKLATWIAEQQADMLIKGLQHKNLEVREEARKSLAEDLYEGNAGTEAFTFPDLLGSVALTILQKCHLEKPDICNITINERKEVYSYNPDRKKKIYGYDGQSWCSLTDSPFFTQEEIEVFDFKER